MVGILLTFVGLGFAVFFRVLPFKASIGYYEFLGMCGASMALAWIMAFYLYISSRLSSATSGRDGLAPHGHTGNVIYDFFIGRTLNPRIGSFDFKYFNELRPGLMLWALIDLSMAAYQYEKYGHVTYSMMLVCAFQIWYVGDALFSETAILTTMDITTDGFGWMLSFGDLVWVPFSFSTQARYLADHPEAELSMVTLALTVLFKAVGFWIFRGANNEKDEFRSNPTAPKFANYTFIQTERGTKLLTSGWWGMARHINYLGDWLMAVAWCLPCGFQSPVPWFYLFYFVPLLIHREIRDEAKCRDKYRADWERYCQHVRYRIIPYVY